MASTPPASPVGAKRKHEWWTLSDSQRVLVSGGVAGSLAKTVTAPLSRLAILFQVHSMVTTKPNAPQYAEGLLPAVRKVIGKEGFLSFWKGNGTSVIHRFPYSAINFYFFEEFKKALHQHFGWRSESAFTRFLAGAGGCAIACVGCYPLDLVRTRLTTQLPDAEGNLHYRGILHAHLRIVQEEGIVGLYHGLATTLVVQVPNLAISYSMYGFLKECAAASTWLHPTEHEPEAWLPNSGVRNDGAVSTRTVPRKDSWLKEVGINLSCGALSGIASALVTYPADVLRRRMQLQRLHRAVEEQRGPWKEMLCVLRSEGLTGLYRGLTPELLKVVPMVGVTFVTYEKMKQLLGCEDSTPK